MGKNFAYVRVSTDAQCLDRQIDMLSKYVSNPNDIFKEKISGVKSNRPELDKLKMCLREGDTVYVESLSRLGRSTRDLLNLLEEWDANGVTLVSIKENIDTHTPTGKLLTTVLSALSQFERDLIVQRTKEGLLSARARGRNGGRPKADQKQIERAKKLYDSRNYSIKEITEISGVPSSTLYRYLKTNE